MIKDIQLVLRLLFYKFGKRRFPAHVAISVTNRCNLRCTYCFARYNAHEKDAISTEKMISLIDELASKGTRLINLTGGEPLIRKDIKTIIDYITQTKGIKCSVSTNGHLLEGKIKTLKNVSSINISLDGNEKQHNINRGEQDYKKVIGAIELAVKNHIPVSTCTVLNRDNADCVDEIVNLAKEKGFLSIFHLPYGRLKEKEYEDLRPMTSLQTKDAMRKIIGYKNSGSPVYYSNSTHSYVRDWPFKYGHLVKKSKNSTKHHLIPCRAGDLYCFIDANGRVYPCTVLSGQTTVKNFLEVGFQEAWNYLPQTTCRSCPYLFQNELNLLLGLDFSTWFNFVKTTRILRQRE